MDTMLFMDWRDDHLAGLPDIKARNNRLPTFLYAMPFTKTKVWPESLSGWMGGVGVGGHWVQALLQMWGFSRMFVVYVCGLRPGLAPCSGPLWIIYKRLGSREQCEGV